MLCRQLAARAQDVHLLTSVGVDKPTGPYELHDIIPRWNWRAVPQLMTALRNIQPDVVLLIWLDWIYENGHPMITHLPRYCRRVLPHSQFFTMFENIAAPKQYWTRSRRRRALLTYARSLLCAQPTDILYGDLLRQSDGVITLCQAHREHFASRHHSVHCKSVVIPAPPLLNILNDGDGRYRELGRRTLGFAADQIVLVFFGFLYEMKGVETLLRALHLCRDAQPGLKLVFVGGLAPNCEHYFRCLKELEKQLDLSDRIIWTGKFDPEAETASTLLHAADICVLPFNGGLKLHNSSFAVATCHGLPVLSTLPSQLEPQFRHGSNVYLVPPKDPQRMAQALLLLARHPKLREQLRAGSLQLAAEYFNWTKVMDDMIHFIESVSDRYGHALSSS